MGRWSRQVGARFIDWLAIRPGADWLDIGCGTGALTSCILAGANPRSIAAIDPSSDLVAAAQAALNDARIRFLIGDAMALPVADRCADVVASGLVLNFIGDIDVGLGEMLRAARPGGLLAFYVWDYAGSGVDLIAKFWEAAIVLNPQAAVLDERRRFAMCSRDGLKALLATFGLWDVELVGIEIDTVFADFEAFWHPFTLGAGPAPGYCAALDEAKRARLKARLQAELILERPIRMRARAWAVKARITA